MKGIVALSLIVGFLLSCSNRNDNNKEQINSANNYYSDDYEDNQESKNEDQILNGEYCATVTYFNPNTGTKSEYTLTIEVYNNELEKLNFPKGWLDDEHYGYVEFDEAGYASFTSDKGYDYTVQIIGEIDGCLENVPRAVQCIGITDVGDQCENLTDNPSGFCWQHEDQAN